MLFTVKLYGPLETEVFLHCPRHLLRNCGDKMFLSFTDRYGLGHTTSLPYQVTTEFVQPEEESK